MKTLVTRLFHSFSTCLVVLVSASYAHADDTEIFFGNPSGNGVIPNVMFILDNSGSMRTEVSTQTEYDSTQTYTGWIEDKYIYIYNGNNYQGVISRSNTTCQTMLNSIDGSAGLYTSAKVASYSNSQWRDVLRSASWINSYGNYDSSVTECYDDRKVHGQTAASGNKYARKGTNKSMWTSRSGRELGWGGISLYEYRSANYMNWNFFHRTATTQKRIDIMKGVINNLVDSTSGLNIGLMSFNTDNGGKQGGRVNIPLDYIETNRAAFKTSLNSLNPDTWTPLSETLLEAMRYYEGGNVFLGSQSVAASKDPGNSSKYKSPIISECQPNNIVLLTDGEPTYDAYLSGSYSSTDDGASRTVIQSEVGKCSGNCLDEVAKHMYDHDMRPTGLNDKQNIKTYTIGFNLDDPLLKRTAEGDGTQNNIGGGGLYFTADDTAQLDSALKDILNDIKSTNTTFVTPGVAVNSFNRLNHRDELYFSVFKPELRPEWSGNLKRYRLGSDGNIYDAVNVDAIDDTTGFFKSSAQSIWSSQVDGDQVSLGGFASKLPTTNSDRKVFTYITGNSLELTDASNEVSVANKANVSKALLGIAAASDAEHESLINWTRGMDANDDDGDSNRTEGRQVILDPLHSPPVVVIYGGTDAAPDSTVFISDNQGFLHAVNAQDGTRSGYGNSEGEELFAFIPEDLLVNQKALYDNLNSASHPYGLDGAISTWTRDVNGDNQLNGSGDFVRIFAGMRRGGRNYYALDVTDRTKPKFLWDIKGGVIGDDFEELGQTWSRPAKTKIKLQGNLVDVLIFGGGYDTNQDSALSKSTDTSGRAVFIINAETGQLIWSANITSFPDMKYSIPSDVRIIDINGDGATDQMYVGDMGGQVWRFDIDNENSKSSPDVYGGVIADLSGSTATENRRFYHAPDVSFTLDGGTRKVAIAIGSGWQAHPLDDVVVDRFFLIKNEDVTERPIDANGAPDYVKLTESDLYDATDNHLGHVSAVNTTAQQVQAYLDYARAEGWYITLERPGEKVLASSLTVNNELFFTTYEPTPNTSGCNISAGTPRIFHINLGNATPINNYDGIGKDTELTAPDREYKLKTTSLPTTPQRLRVDGKDQLCIGTECQQLNTGESVIDTYWIEEE
jgi:type IV pilus assembly protein PilY1